MLKAAVFFMLIQTSTEPGTAFQNQTMAPPAATFGVTRVDGFASLDACNIVAKDVVKNQMASTGMVKRYTKADCYPFLELDESEDANVEEETEQ
jgi:hypothetical protein